MARKQVYPTKEERAQADEPSISPFLKLQDNLRIRQKHLDNIKHNFNNDKFWHDLNPRGTYSAAARQNYLQEAQRSVADAKRELRKMMETEFDVLREARLGA